MRLLLILIPTIVAAISADALACKKCLTDQREPIQTYFGLNADPIADVPMEELPKFLASLKSSGAGSLRMPLRWNLLEPEKGGWDFAKADAVVAQLPDDLEVIVVLTGVPAWAKPSAASNPYPFADLQNWANFVRTITKRYSHRLRHFEMFPGGNTIAFGERPDARAYAEVLRVSHESIKQVEPNCIVILGGLYLNGIVTYPLSRARSENFLVDLYEAGAQRYFDAVNIQPYVQPLDGAPRVMQLVQQTLAVMARYGDGDKPLYLSEIGCAAADETSRAMQAKLLAATYAAALDAKNICHVIWFNLHDTRPEVSPDENLAAAGLVDSTWQPKPAFEAFQRATKERVIR